MKGVYRILTPNDYVRLESFDGEGVMESEVKRRAFSQAVSVAVLVQRARA